MSVIIVIGSVSDLRLTLVHFGNSEPTTTSRDHTIKSNESWVDLLTKLLLFVHFELVDSFTNLFFYFEQIYSLSGIRRD